MNVSHGCQSCALVRLHCARWQADEVSVLERVELLSAREWDVFRLLSTGSSNRDVSRALCITERTVKAHIASIVAKLEVAGRFQAGLVSYVYHVQNCPNGQ